MVKKSSARSLRIRVRLGEECRKDIAEMGSRLYVIEGDVSIRIGGAYIGEIDGMKLEGPLWLEGYLVDDFLMSFLRAAIRLRKDSRPFSVELRGSIIRLRLLREGERLFVTPWIEAQLTSELPRFRPVRRTAVAFGDFIDETLNALRGVLREVDELNPEASKSEIVRTLASAGQELNSEAT